jgi:hypothetical protein
VASIEAVMTAQMAAAGSVMASSEKGFQRCAFIRRQQAPGCDVEFRSYACFSGGCRMSYLYRATMSHFNGYDKDEWMVALVIVMAAGFLCMRGFGSRNNY